MSKRRDYKAEAARARDLLSKLADTPGIRVEMDLSDKGTHIVITGTGSYAEEQAVAEEVSKAIYNRFPTFWRENLALSAMIDSLKALATSKPNDAGDWPELDAATALGGAMAAEQPPTPRQMT